jgi:hypothetical protein
VKSGCCRRSSIGTARQWILATLPLPLPPPLPVREMVYPDGFQDLRFGLVVEGEFGEDDEEAGVEAEAELVVVEVIAFVLESRSAVVWFCISESEKEAEDEVEEEIEEEDAEAAFFFSSTDVGTKRLIISQMGCIQQKANDDSKWISVASAALCLFTSVLMASSEVAEVLI